MNNDIKITLIQTELFWEDPEANRKMLEEKILSIDQQTHIVILPEMFTTGFSMQPEKFAETMEGPTVEWMRQIAIKKKVILTGSLMINENGKYYNRLIWMLPNGQLGFYDKRHLFAFGKEDAHYNPGEKRFIASVNGWKINLQICYDLRFPVWARQSNIKNNENLEYDILIYVANWPERRIHAWKSLLMARAIENQSYVVGVNRVENDGHNIYHNGCSSVIDPLGEIIYQKENSEDIYTVSLSHQHLNDIRQKFPFWRDADSFKIL